MHTARTQGFRLKSLVGYSAGILALGFAFIALALGMKVKAADRADGCDEGCLKGVMDTYLDALSKHDPSLVPVAAHYRYTENGAQVSLGEALWVTFNSYGKYRHDVYEPETGGIATYLSIIENHEMPYADFLAVRLKVVNRKITEIETVVDRHAQGTENMPPKDPTWMDTMNRVEPESTRISREALKKAALGYTREVAFHNGDLAPFAESCIRLENGTLSALGPNDNPPIPVMKSPPLANGAPPSFFVLGLGCGK